MGVENNQQQLFFICSFFRDEGAWNGGQPIRVGIQDKDISEIEIFPNTTGPFLPFRVHFDDSSLSLWMTWDSEKECREWFERAGLLE